MLAVAFTALGLVSPACNPGQPWWRKPDLAVDVLYWTAIPLVSGFARVGFLAAGAALITGGLEPGRIDAFFAHGAGPLAALPFWGQVAAYLILADLMMYGTHRAFHGASLWRYHAVHHAPEHLEWISANRFHPINIVLHSTLADGVLLLGGIAPEVLVFLVPFNVGMSALVHANLDWTFGPFRYVLASPVFHRWHHTDVERGGAKNFAPTFPLIDVAFGTFYMPKGVLPDRYGVDDATFPREFVAQLIYPFRAARPAAPAPDETRPLPG